MEVKAVTLNLEKRNLRKIVIELRDSNYTCEKGKLVDNMAFKELMGIADVYTTVEDLMTDALNNCGFSEKETLQDVYYELQANGFIKGGI